jgi:copper homeostasis protein
MKGSTWLARSGAGAACAAQAARNRIDTSDLGTGGIFPHRAPGRYHPVVMPGGVLLEVCVTSVESAVAAERGGAARVELVSNPLEGGVTPSAGLLARARERVRVRLQVIIRPRGGDFCYGGDEFAVMEADVLAARRGGADGVVLGLLHPDGRVDVERTRRLVELARPLNVTFHRAFDMAADLPRALEEVIATGADRLLTSGGARSASEGAEVIANLVTSARGRIVIMAGGGIRAGNARDILQRTSVRELHAGLEEPSDSPMTHRNEALAMGTAGDREYRRFLVREETVRAFVNAI